MPVQHDGDAITDVIVRCRALWGLFSDVPETIADEMAAELAAHLRDHVAAGGTIEEVVGTDLKEFAAAWGNQRRGSVRPVGRVLRAVNAPLTTVATYAVVAQVLAWVRGDAAWLVHVSDLVWLAGLVAAAALVTRPEVLGRILTSPRRAPALLAAVMLGVVPLAVPVLARTLLLFGPTLVGWPWWASLLLVVAAIASLAGTKPTAHGR